MNVKTEENGLQKQLHSFLIYRPTMIIPPLLSLSLLLLLSAALLTPLWPHKHSSLILSQVLAPPSESFLVLVTKHYGKANFLGSRQFMQWPVMQTCHCWSPKETGRTCLKHNETPSKLHRIVRGSTPRVAADRITTETHVCCVFFSFFSRGIGCLI